MLLTCKYLKKQSKNLLDISNYIVPSRYVCVKLKNNAWMSGMIIIVQMSDVALEPLVIR